VENTANKQACEGVHMSQTCREEYEWYPGLH